MRGVFSLLEVKGIAEEIVNRLVERSNQLGEGRSVGTIGFIDDNGYISGYNKMINGGLSGLHYRMLLSEVSKNNYCSLL